MDSHGRLNIAELYSGKYTAKQRDAILHQAQRISAVRIQNRTPLEKFFEGVKRVGHKVVHATARVGEKFGEISGKIAAGVGAVGAGLIASGIGAPIGVLFEGAAAGIGAVSAATTGLGSAAKKLEKKQGYHYKK